MLLFASLLSALLLRTAAPALLSLASLSGYPDALCNDGTPAAYYFRPATAPSSDVWLVFLESGGWCYSADTCSRRSAAQTSSASLAPTLDLA